MISQLHLAILNLSRKRGLVQLLNDSLLSLLRHSDMDGWGERLERVFCLVTVSDPALNFLYINA